jgi:hypothetical protein
LEVVSGGVDGGIKGIEIWPVRGKLNFGMRLSLADLGPVYTGMVVVWAAGSWGFGFGGREKTIFSHFSLDWEMGMVEVDDKVLEAFWDEGHRKE